MSLPKIDLHIAPVPLFWCQTKRLFSYSKFTFSAGTKLFGGALKFNSSIGLAQNIWTHTKKFGSCRRKALDFGLTKYLYIRFFLFNECEMKLIDGDLGQHSSSSKDQFRGLVSRQLISIIYVFKTSLKLKTRKIYLSAYALPGEVRNVEISRVT